VRKLFGVKGDLFGLIPGRVTFVVDKNGVVRHVFNSQMNAEKHITESLAAIEKLKNE
jgi:peroxiredoxin Q/BCP